MCAVPDHRPAGFERGGHFRAHVLDRLEGSDHAIELLAFLGIGDGIVEHFLRGAQGICSEHDTARIDHAPQHFDITR